MQVNVQGTSYDLSNIFAAISRNNPGYSFQPRLSPRSASYANIFPIKCGKRRGTAWEDKIFKDFRDRRLR